MHTLPDDLRRRDWFHNADASSRVHTEALGCYKILLPISMVAHTKFSPPIRLTDKCGWDRRVGCDRCPEFTTVVLNLDKEKDEKESWRLPFETKGAYALWAELSDDHCCAWSVLWMITAAYDYCCVLWPVSTRICMLRLQSFIVKPSWSQQAALKERLLLFMLSCCGGMNAVMESLSSNGVSAQLFCPSVSSMAIW